MATATTQRRYTTLMIYLVAIVLINVVGVSLFTRFDLTQSGAFSLSPVSRQVIAELSEPLTIKVFFTKNLPAPHNGTERYLRDLLDEYALGANRNFNYQFYEVSPEAEGVKTAIENRKLAADYGIHPVQIQVVENDEVKFKNAYMGLVILHGDAIERIPTITSTAGLEYRLTTAIQKMQHKISALLALKDNIRINLVLSSSLNQVAPFMGLKQLPELPAQIEQLVARLNPKNYNRLTFTRTDPSTADQMDALTEDSGVLKLEWQAIDQAGVPAGAGAIGMTVSSGDKTVGFRLLNVLHIPIIGTRYELASIDQLEETLTENIERLLDINENIGGLGGHGSIMDAAAPAMNQQRRVGAGNFRTLLSDRYSIKTIDPATGPIPSSLKSMIIARPTEHLSDYALYQIDQALMRGTNLIFFLDAFKEEMPTQQGFNQARGPQYTPMDTGLEAMLTHYGVTIEPAFVLDENCYKQPRPQNMGGGETPIYFAPLIRNQGINQSVDFLKNIRGMLAVKVSPLVLNEKQLSANQITATPLLTASNRSWQMAGRIDLNPMTIFPPPDSDRKPSPPIAYLLEGKFPSYFAGKPIPEKPAASKTQQTAPAAGDTPNPVAASGDRRDVSAPARIFVMASSEMISDNLIDGRDKTTPNSVFVMNVIDALNGRADIAQMRGKQQTFNPLDITDPSTKTAIKTANIAGLPVLIIFAGLIVMALRHARKRRIQATFATQGE